MREGTLSRWQAFSVAGVLLLAGIFLAAMFAAGCYLVSLVVVGIARGGSEQDFREDPGVVVAAVAVLLGAATVALYTVVTFRRRGRAAQHSSEMELWADARGWVYTPRSSLLSSRWSAPGIHGRTQATDVLTRSTPRGEVTSTTLGPGAGGARTRTHAVMVVGPRWFPALSITPTTGIDRVEQAFGGQDITVESYDVNERWRMRCSDARFAHEVLHPRLLERLDRTAMPGLCVLVQGRDVVALAPGPTALASIEPMMNLVLDLASLLPTYLSDDYPPLSPEVPRRERRRSPRRQGRR
ncbi:MAG: hypothetical protein HHJ11_13735 [Phycicoccus sp.]|nr:hypothetical protein [Phycicoccus sp.]